MALLSVSFSKRRVSAAVIAESASVANRLRRQASFSRVTSWYMPTPGQIRTVPRPRQRPQCGWHLRPLEVFRRALGKMSTGQWAWLSGIRSPIAEDQELPRSIVPPNLTILSVLTWTGPNIREAQGLPPPHDVMKGAANCGGLALVLVAVMNIESSIVPVAGFGTNPVSTRHP
jgi:hypothetical protein